VTQTTATQRGREHSNKNAIRPFRVDVPEAELAELHRRINATKWPERETVTDASQGVQLATIQALARYWTTDYDWRRCEAKLTPCRISSRKSMGSTSTSFMRVQNTKMHCHSSVTHGWPGSVVEQLKISDPFTNPTAHGASASDAFDAVVSACMNGIFLRIRPEFRACRFR